MKKNPKEYKCPKDPNGISGVVFAVLIIALVWISPELWSKIAITIAAVLIILANLARKKFLAENKI